MLTPHPGEMARLVGRPVADLITETSEKYRRPCIVAETSGLHGGRPDWRAFA